MTEPEISTNSAWSIMYWPAIIILFLVVHLTTDKFKMLANNLLQGNVLAERTVDTLLPDLPFIKLLFFIAAFTLLIIPLAVEFGRLVKLRESLRAMGVSLCLVVILFGLACYIGNASMGEAYSEISINPFAQSTGVYSRRLLMPAIAHIIFMDGYWPYYWFSMSLTTVFIALLHNWCLKNTSLKTWQILSLCSSSFVIFQFQFPGYPDILFYIMIILVMGENLEQKSRLTLLILALLVHESSVFICSLLALRYLGKENLYQYFTAVSLYFFVFFAANGFDIHAVFGMHSVESKSGLEWVLDSFSNEILGLASAWKALWILAAVATFQALRCKNYRDGLFIPAAMGSGIFVTLLAVDTSRLAGFAFPGILICLSFMASLQKPATRRFLSYLFFLNIIIPSVYVGLNTGILVREGLYHFIFQFLQSSIAVCLK